MIQFRYRPDVDGLRAVAVGMVLLFHAGLGFKGGFVGVDVFFVISGFLITGLILKESSDGKFSFVNFLARRVRRIIPAATVVVTTVLLVGACFLLPSDYEELGKSAIAQQLMFSNVFFWRHGGYFAGPADLKPLLHTWSLAVEEQFYLGYPLLLSLLRRFPRQLMFVFLLGVGIMSLALSEWGVRHHPSATFYLLPARAWELLLGGLICLAPAPKRFAHWQLNLLSLLGFGGILASGWFYSSETPFPGLSAALPCCATAAVIYSNSTQLTCVGRLLASGPFLFVGLISYSLYLWHWPILAYLRYESGQKLAVMPAILALSAAFVLAYLSWRFIETPFRTVRLLKSKRMLGASALGSLCTVCAASLLVVLSGGFQSRYDQAIVPFLLNPSEQVDLSSVSESDVLADTLPTFGVPHVHPSILLWGDSHAMGILPALDEACKHCGLSGVQATHVGTIPLLGFPNRREWSAPDTYATAVVDYIVRNKVKVVVLAGYWRRDAESELFAPCLERTVQTLLSHGCSLVLVRDVPIQEISPTRDVIKRLSRGADPATFGVSLRQHREFQALADAALLSVERYGVVVLDPTPYLTDERERCRIFLDGKRLYLDEQHINVAGARRLVPMFSRMLEDIGLNGSAKTSSISYKVEN